MVNVSAQGWAVIGVCRDLVPFCTVFRTISVCALWQQWCRDSVNTD